jgi:adenylate cyclase
LLDIVMPELDGVSVSEHVKGDAALQEVPVIMISGVDDSESVVHFVEIGADDYLPKPFDPVLLRARISAGLTKKRLGTVMFTDLRASPRSASRPHPSA